MKSNKIIFVAIGIAIVSILITVGVLFMTASKSKGGQLTQGMSDVVLKYTQEVNSGNYETAYEMLSDKTKQYISQENYAQLMKIMFGGENMRIELDKTKEISDVKQKIGDSVLEYTSIPINRVNIQTIDGTSNTIKDNLNIGILVEKSENKVYITESTYYGCIAHYVLGSANEIAVELLENKENENLVSQNAVKIDELLKFALTVPSSYSGYTEVVLQANLVTAYKLLAQGDRDNAINTVQSSYAMAETKEQKLKIYRVESEIYYAEGKYAEAVKVLKQALEVDPSNTDIRRDYRRINSMMIDQIGTALTSGWAQVQSAIKQEDEERTRILEDIALAYAEEAIAVKADAPDGYYLKGNIEYCLERYSDAISSLEKAVELARAEDLEYKTKASEILGMARVAQASKEKPTMESYQQIFNKDIRSLLFRENEVSGIVDTIK